MIARKTMALTMLAVVATGGLLALMAGCPGTILPPTETNPCDQPGVICTVAGTGLSVFDGDGRPALRTSFYLPLDIDFDSAGRPLILDFNNLRIRRIEDDTSVHTIMGRGFESDPVEGALAKDTSLHHASDIAMDAAGRMYVAGDHAPVVFRVELDDRVHVMAGSDDPGNDGDGGPATAARLTEPYGVLPLDAGSFYVSDIEAHVVRFVDARGFISTVAGNGTRGYSGDNGPGPSAQLDGPTRLARDPMGRVCFCDSNNHVIRRLATDGTITTIAGTGQPGYSGDGGPARLAQLNTPYDVQFGPGGDLYVADTGNNVIRRISAAGTVTTVVGTGVAGFAGDEGDARFCQLNAPGGLKFDARGNLWIADTLNQRIRRVAGFLSLPR